MKYLKNLAIANMLVLSSAVYAQKPTEMPRAQDTHVDFSEPANIVLFIVLPIIAVLLYFLWRKKTREDRKG